MHYRKVTGIIAGTAAVALALTACSSSKGGGGTSSTGSGGLTKGPFTVVQGKDNSNILPTLAQMWDSTHPDQKITFKQQSDSADDQLQDLRQHFQAKDPGYDVVSVDVVWTAELAASGWLQPLKGDFALDESTLLPATVKAATYVNTLYAAPSTSDGGMLYYRKDLFPTAPTTWDELIADCTKLKTTSPSTDCYAGQYANYEGLTVNVAEAINAAGGIFIQDDGKTPNVDTDAAKTGLNFLVNGFKDGYIPKDAIGYKETEGLNSFIAGKLAFLRNWPYANAIASNSGTNKGSVVADKFSIAPLPGPSGQGASSLGGHSWAISNYSQHKGSALDYLKWVQTSDVQKFLAKTGAPVIASLYTDADQVKLYPYFPILLKSIDTAVPRPVTPYYSAVTKAIEVNSYAALQGSKSTDQALSDMQAALKAATGG